MTPKSDETIPPFDPRELGEALGNFCGMVIVLNNAYAELKQRIEALEATNRANAAAIRAAGNFVPYGRIPR